MDPTPPNGPIGSRGNGGVPADSTPIPLGRSLADQWRAHLKAHRQRETVVVPVDLPSGMRVMAMRPSLLALLAAGRIPDALAGPVQDLIALGEVAGGGVATELAKRQAADPVGFAAAFLAILDHVWLAAVVEPRFAADDGTADAEALPVGAVGVDDKTFLFVWAQGVDQTVAQFLDRKGRPTPPVGPAPDGPGVRPGPGDPGRGRYEG